VSLNLAIELDGAAVPKGRHHTKVQQTKSGRTFAQQYPDGKTGKYEAQLRFAAQCAMRDQAPGQPPTILPCRLVVDVYLQAPQTPPGGKGVRAAMLRGEMRPTKKPDADNYLKTVGDALNGAVWSDDSCIAEALVRKWWAEHPRLVIRVETIEPPPMPARPRDALAGDLFAGAGA
jgi:Holliday junction resolvase RusA-like endonuclease